MTTSDDMTPRQPDEDEPLKEVFGDVLDLVDKTVERITDAEVDEHLRKVLSQSGYSGHLAHSCGQFTGPWRKYNPERWANLADLTASDELRRTQEDAGRDGSDRLQRRVPELLPRSDMDRPGNLGGSDSWEDAGSWRHSGSTPRSCANAQ